MKKGPTCSYITIFRKLFLNFFRTVQTEIHYKFVQQKMTVIRRFALEFLTKSRDAPPRIYLLGTLYKHLC